MNWFKTKKGTLVQDKKGYVGSNFGIASALSNYPSDTWGKEDIKLLMRRLLNVSVILFLMSNDFGKIFHINE